MADASASSGSSQPTREACGFRRIFAAYRSTQATDIEVRSSQRIIRSRMPSPMETPASPAATPIENGLTVAAMTPVSAPRMIIEAVTIRS